MGVLLALWLAAPARAAFGDEVTDGQAAILSLFGVGPAFSDALAPQLGVGLVWTSTDLFERLEPSLRAPFTGTAALVFGGAGVGPGMFGAEVRFHFDSPERRSGDLTAHAPTTFSVTYYSGANLLALAGDKHPVGLGPAVFSHSGVQGPLEVRVDKVGALSVGELMHWNLGAGGAAYLAFPPGFGVTGHFGYMPSFNALLTMGKFEGAGRFELDEPDIFVPIDRFDEVIAGLVEAENQFRYRDSFVFGGRLSVGPVLVSYDQRIVRYAPKNGSGVDPDVRFQLVQHGLSVNFGGFLVGEL